MDLCCLSLSVWLSSLRLTFDFEVQNDWRLVFSSSELSRGSVKSVYTRVLNKGVLQIREMSLIYRPIFK